LDCPQVYGVSIYRSTTYQENKLLYIRHGGTYFEIPEEEATREYVLALLRGFCKLWGHWA
jgi:hypothetical protein